MSLSHNIDILINIVIWVAIFWFVSNIYIFIVFLFNNFGIHGILFDLQFFGTDILSYIYRYLLLFGNIFLCVVLSLLSWIFVFWMIILLFIPSIIIIPIPMIPFIIPIPLQNIMLNMIPPFKALTERGILPWCLRIVYIFFSADSLKTKFSKSFTETYGLLYDDIKKILGEILQEPKHEVISENNNDINKLPSIDDNTNNKEIANKLINNDSYGDKKQVMELIEDELNLCFANKQSFKVPNANNILTSADDLNNYSECYAISAKSYLLSKL